MKKPILAMIPSGYKASTLYTPIPIDGVGDFTVARSTVANRINKDGLIEEVAANVPRLDYSDSKCPSLLLETSSTNLITYSEDFTDASWIKQDGVTIEANTEISPTGALNASYVAAGVGTSKTPRILFYFSSVLGVTYEFSVFVKKKNIDWVRLLSTGATSLTSEAYYNISNGSIGVGGIPALATIDDYGNGWYRLGLKVIADTTNASANFRVQISDSDNGSTITTNGTEKITVWGGQLEENEEASSYIETTGTAVTRGEDTCINGNVLNLVDDYKGSMFAETKSTKAVGVFQSTRLSAGNSFTNSIRLLYSPTNFIRIIYRVGDVSLLDKSISYDIREFAKFGITWDSSAIKFYANGVKIDEVLNPTLIAGLDTLYIDSRIITKDIRIYNEVLTEAEAIELTTI